MTLYYFFFFEGMKLPAPGVKSQGTVFSPSLSRKAPLEKAMKKLLSPGSCRVFAYSFFIVSKTGLALDPNNSIARQACKATAQSECSRSLTSLSRAAFLLFGKKANQPAISILTEGSTS